METDVNQDIQDYWNEVKHHSGTEELNDEELSSRSCDEGELETEWLKDAGLSHLTEPFLRGREISESELEGALLDFSKPQAEAIKRRVKTLNNTIRQRRSKAKHRKADVRDVFRDYENHSIGSQSRSATPDSLDPLDSFVDADNHTTTIQLPDNTSNNYLYPSKSKKSLSRVPSAPVTHHLQSKQHSGTVHHQEIFRNYMPDVPGSDGLRLLKYQYVGTLPRQRSGSDPLYLDVADDLIELSTTDGKDVRNSMKRLSRSHGNLLETGEGCYYWESSQVGSEDRTWIDSLDEADVELLKPRFHTQVTSLLDNCKQFRRKPVKTQRKSEGNVFGVALSTLLMKDEYYHPHERSSNHVPLIFEKLIYHLEQYYLKEEGLLRVAGLKARTELLTTEIENLFYDDPTLAKGAPHTGKCLGVLHEVTAHDVTSALKKLLRELPEPLLTFKYLYLFYATHGLEEDKRKEALNLLVLLLPKEHQSTLRYLLKFLIKVTQYKESNKMGIHSVATIIAPSLFPPRFIRLAKDDVASQVKSAEICITLAEDLLRWGETLWVVPRYLISQLRSLNQSRNDRKENSRPKFFGKSRHKTVNRVPDVHSGRIFVEALQFGLKQLSVSITETTTARDVILKVMSVGTDFFEKSKEPTKERVRGNAVLAPRGFALSCFLSSADPDMALQTHFLYEYGGNIVQRELEHSVLVSGVLRENPGASWRLQCRHRNCPKR